MSELAPIQSNPLLRFQLNSTNSARPKRPYRGKPKGRPPGQGVPIADSALLKQLVDSAIDREGGGTVRAAARRAKLGEKLLGELIAMKKKEIDVGNYIKLHQLIPVANHERLRCAFVVTELEALAQGFHEWLVLSARATSVGVGVRWVRTAQGFVRRPDAERDIERAELWEYYKTRRPLKAASFEQKLGDHPDAPLYGRVIVARILDPLLNAPASGFRETSWQELRQRHPSRLLQFIELGITREMLLVRSELPMKRLLHVLRLQPQEMRESFGDAAAE